MEHGNGRVLDLSHVLHTRWKKTLIVGEKWVNIGGGWVAGFGKSCRKPFCPPPRLSRGQTRIRITTQRKNREREIE
jgi:hypothetical protein